MNATDDPLISAEITGKFGSVKAPTDRKLQEYKIFYTQYDFFIGLLFFIKSMQILAHQMKPDLDSLDCPEKKPRYPMYVWPLH